MMLRLHIDFLTPFEELVLRSMFNTGDAADDERIWRAVRQYAGRAKVPFGRVKVALRLLERTGAIRSEVCKDGRLTFGRRIRCYSVTSRGYLAMECAGGRRKKGREYYEQASRFGLWWDLVSWVNRRTRAMFTGLSVEWDTYFDSRAEKAERKRRQPEQRRNTIYLEVILADWKNHRGIAYTNAAATILVMLAVTWLKPHDVDARLALILSSVFSAVLISQFCSRFDRNSGRNKALLGPETADQFIFAKFVSALSMTAFAINVPGLMLLDFRFLLNVNAGVLLLGTICLSSTLTDWQVSGGGEFFEILVIPILILVSATYWWGPTAYDYGKVCVDWLFSHPTLMSITALCAIPVIIVFSIVNGIEME